MTTMTNHTLARSSGCQPATSGEWAKRTLRKCGETIVGWVGVHYPSARSVGKVARMSETTLSRIGSGERSPDYGAVSQILVDETLPMERAEELPRLDPRMYQPCREDCDLDLDGLLCETDDALILIQQIDGLTATLRAWLGNPNANPAAVRAVARAISMKGQQLSHVVRHIGEPEAAGVGI